MKKLFLLLILYLFSTQGLAASCPDGSDPVKSISADGTYFVYNCGGQSSSSANTGKWNDPNPLDKLIIPENWQLVKDKKAFEKARRSFKARIPQNPDFKEKVCLNVAKNWRKSMELYTSSAGQKQKDENSAFGADNQDMPTDLQNCLDKLIYTTQNYTGTPNYMKEILLHWAKTDAVFIPSGVKDEKWGNYLYEAVQSWSSFGSYYGTFYDEFNYSDADRKIVDAYIKNKLLNVNSRNLYEKSFQACDPDNLEKTVNGQFNSKIDADTCGSSVWKTTLAQLLVGLRLNNKALFKKGVENTKWQLSFFDDTGIFTTWAIKGASAYQYSSSIPIMLGGLTEIYASVGYDFMEHKLRNGLSVKQLMDRQYELFLDPHILDSYVKRYPHDYKGTPNSVYLQSSVEQIIGQDMNLTGFVRNLPRYIDTYRADIGNSREFDKELGKQSMDLKGTVAYLSTGNFQPLDPYLVYISHITEPEVSSSEKTKTAETPTVATSDSDPTVSKVIEVIHGDTFRVNIAEPHELAGSNIKLIIRDANTPDATKSCSRQMELGIKVKDIVTQKLADASNIKLKNFRKTNTAVIAQVIVDGKDLGEELIAKGYASNEYGHWKAYFCSALQAMAAGDSNWKYGTVDSDKAIFWYERAIFLDPDRDQKLVTYDLSELYMMNGDTKKSIDYLKQSAKLGHLAAEEALGAAYMNGNGVPKDRAQAKKWLKKAYENGSDSAEDICGCEF
jgi:endonuclease YncB( thermonuclease family)